MHVAVELWSDPNSWDAYVTSNPASSNYHRWGWREVIEESFRHRPYYLAAVRGRHITGVLPLVHVKSRIFGSPLVSMPFFSYGGVLADDAESREALLCRAQDLAKNIGASHVELRQGESQPTDWLDSTHKVTMELPLPPSTDDLWKGLSSGMRNKIRNAKRNGFRTEWGGIEAVRSFYRIFSLNMRNLGTPVYSEQWFLNMCQRFPREVRILTLWDGVDAVASGFVTCYGNAVELPWSATVPESRKKYSAVFLYWTLLEWAIVRGYRKVDFGRCTKGSGVYEFKRHWGSTERVLHWYYSLSQRDAVPQLHADNPRYQVVTNVWKRLPLGLANFLGPRIVRSIP